MASIEPTVEFGKNADDNTAANDFDISYAHLGAPGVLPAGPGTVDGNLIAVGDQTENWINKASQVVAESEQSFWDQASLDVYNPIAPDPNFIDSGCGLINDTATSKDIIRGNVSRIEHIRVYNNRAALWTLGAVWPAGQQVSAAENSRMVVYDNPSVDTQNDEPIVAKDASLDALYWTSVEQLDYHYWSGAAWVATGETNGQALLGDTGPLSVSALNEPHATLGGALQGVSTYRVGHQIAGSAFIGTRQAQAAPPTYGYRDCEGGYVDLEIQWWVPDNASARFHSIALAVEYTFVLE